MKTRNEKISATKTDGREAFFAKCREVHGDTYNYADVVFTKASDKLTFTCRTHGEFTQLGYAHRHGQGCPACAAIKRGANQPTKTSLEAMLNRFTAVHGDTYDYSKVTQVSTRLKATITCRKHGDFQQSFRAHASGHGCARCAEERNGSYQVYGADEFARRAAEVHSGKYAYTGDYCGSKQLVTIMCPAHGAFVQKAGNHVNNEQGCPKCARTSSKPEAEISNIVAAYGYSVEAHHRPDWMQGKELDIFVPELNLAIEYCGSHVHNNTRHVYGGNTKREWYHYNKWKLCRDNGVTLLTIYDFEWFASREKWEAVIRHKLQKADRRVYARKCQIVSVERAVAYQFCKDHHIESAGGAWTYQALCLGLAHQGELVAVMVEDKGDIKRSCTLSGTAVIGGVSRLFKAFPAGTTMMTTNNTGSSGNYGTLLDKKTTRYWWVKLGTVPTAIPRRQCQKHLLERRFGVPVGEKTERQYMEDLGYVRCYDSGLSYWVNT